MKNNSSDLPVVNKPVRDPLSRINTIRTDLLGDEGREHIRKVNKGVSQRLRALMERHYGFNPENS